MIDADVTIVGGGAAGLMCAIAAGQRGRRVVVLEGSNKVGKKILMSGGGRCNFTNLQSEPSRFISANPLFCISALSRYTQLDFLALVEKHGIAYHEKTLGQLFCDNTSKDIVAMLLAECESAGVDIATHCEEITISAEDGFLVSYKQRMLACESIVIATGGLSIPKMGASDFGYRVARQFGLNVFETRAGLVPFTFSGATHDLTNRLSGISLRATVGCGDTEFTENILFTHRGLSGPAVLQISSYWSPGEEIRINFLPDTDASELLVAAKRTQPKALPRTILANVLPRALVIELQALLWLAHQEIPLAEIPDAELRRIGRELQAWVIKPAATEGYRTAEVTLGGVDTDELSSQTMECKKHPGLYFIGEVVDVTGHLGGYNFQWAWSSAQAAGQVV